MTGLQYHTVVRWVSWTVGPLRYLPGGVHVQDPKTRNPEDPRKFQEFPAGIGPFFVGIRYTFNMSEPLQITNVVG